MLEIRRYTKHIFLGITVLFSAYLVYSPGFKGNFVLDDFGNLDKLGDFNGIRNFDTFVRFIGNGIAGPTGRPISLLSFLLNGTNWPTDPYPFKVTNVVLHVFCGFFLWLLCRLVLLSHNFTSKQAELGALIAASFWLIHPFLVSTVLYVVQRMAMLSAFFSIAGLWLYGKGRFLLTTTLISENRRAYFYMSLGVGLGTVLAVLSKENGVLLPLLALCLESCIFSHPNSVMKPTHQYWNWLFLYLPCLLIFAYLVYQIDPYTFTHPYGGRNFSMPERLLTESRLVSGYLYHLLIPRLSYPGLLNENIIISKSLFNPLSTFFCTVLIFTLFGGAFLLRKRCPFIALALLFFFAGHVLESTTIGLELYFEHRNYLPAVFLFLPLGQLFVNQEKIIYRSVIILLLLICAVFTHQLSKLWGDELRLMLYWAKQNPTSARAQRTLALALESRGQNLEAFQILDNARPHIPDSLDLNWHWFMLKCQIAGVTEDDRQAILKATQEITFDAHHYNILQAAIKTLTKPECKGSDSQFALSLLDTLITNPGMALNQRLLFQPHHLKGWIFAETNKPKDALQEFTNVLNLMQNVEHGLVQVGVLASHGFYNEALHHLNDIEKIQDRQPKQDSTLLSAKLDYQTEIARIKHNLLIDAKANQTEAPNSQ